MSGCWWLWYGLGVPVVAVIVGGWWLAHFGQAFMQSERSVFLDEPSEPDWYPLRKWLFWVSGLPLVEVGMWLIGRISPRLSCSGYTLIVICYLNGAVWGIGLVTLARVIWMAWTS
jgi:hypothetical protein